MQIFKASCFVFKEHFNFYKCKNQKNPKNTGVIWDLLRNVLHTNVIMCYTEVVIHQKLRPTNTNILWSWVKCKWHDNVCACLSGFNHADMKTVTRDALCKCCSNMLSYNMQISSQATQMGIQWYIEIQTTFFFNGSQDTAFREDNYLSKMYFCKPLY